MSAVGEVVDAEVIEGVEPVTPRQQQIADLRRLLDLLEANPDVPMPSYFGSSRYGAVRFFVGDPVEAAAVCKLIGGSWSKNDPNDSDYDADYLELRTVHGREVHVVVVVSRERVCERRVVGKKLVKKAVVVQPERTEEQYVEVDEVEFECGSLLSAAAQLQMERLAAIAS